VTDGQHISEEDLALYTMGSFDEARDAAELAAIKAHLVACEPCRHLLAEITGDLALLALSVPQQELPAGAQERFMSLVAAEPRQVVDSTFADPSVAGAGLVGPEDDLESGVAVVTAAAGVSRSPAPGNVMQLAPAPAARRPIFTALPWLLAAAMFAAAIYLGSEASQLRASRDQARAESIKLAVEADRAKEVLEVLTAPAAQQVMLTEGKATPSPMGRTSYMPSKGALVFMASHMPSLPTSKAYELWIIPANGHAPMPAGTFRPDEQGSASVLLPPLPAGVPAKAFGVTIERAEGSPIPTTPIIMSGS
jgi:Anti-sigma-K factor rskA